MPVTIPKGRRAEAVAQQAGVFSMIMWHGERTSNDTGMKAQDPALRNSSSQMWARDSGFRGPFPVFKLRPFRASLALRGALPHIFHFIGGVGLETL